MKKIIFWISVIACLLAYAPPGMAVPTGQLEGYANVAALKAVLDRIPVSVTAHGSVSSGTETFGPGIHTVTVSGSFTWEFDDWPSTGVEGVIRVYITNGGAGTITGWSSVLWEGGIAPTLQTSGLDILMFISLDGGTTIYGFVAGEDMQ